MSIVRRSHLLFSILLLTNVVSVLAQDVTAVFTAPSGTLTGGSRASLWLFCMNNSSNSINRTFEPSLNCTLISQSATFETVLVLNTNSSPSAATIAPGGFVKEEYLLDLPLTSSGQVTLDISSYNQLVVLVKTRLFRGSTGCAFATNIKVTTSINAPNTDMREYFATHVSFYEPIYFIPGSAPNVEFQTQLEIQGPRV